MFEIVTMNNQTVESEKCSTVLFYVLSNTGV